MHGLNTVLNVLTQWHESSECLWTIKNKTQNTVDITVKFKYVPVSQIWHIKILSDRKILWKVDIIAEQDLEIDCYKAGFFLSSEYKRWVCGDDEGTFSKINNFERQIKNGSFEDYFLGVRNYQNKNYGYLPGFFIDFSKTRALCFSSILNSNVLLNSRMIYITIDLPRQLKQGRYNLLNFKIIIEEKDSEIEKKIEHLRQLKVKKYENSIG
jgi:hypothetical protein